MGRRMRAADMNGHSHVLQLDNAVTNTWEWYIVRWKEEPGVTLLLSAVIVISWVYSHTVWVRGAVAVFLCLPLYGVLTAKSEDA